jgi:type II secretory pathway component PulF
MARFSYDAIDRRGARIQGQLDAPSRSDAFRQLGSQRLQPVRLELADDGTRTEARTPIPPATDSDALPAISVFPAAGCCSTTS